MTDIRTLFAKQIKRIRVEIENEAVPIDDPPATTPVFEHYGGSGRSAHSAECDTDIDDDLPLQEVDECVEDHFFLVIIGLFTKYRCTTYIRKQAFAEAKLGIGASFRWKKRVTRAHDLAWQISKIFRG